MAARDIELADRSGGHLHIAHASTAGTVELLRQAREKGIHVTAEATPHHLTLSEESVAGGDTNAKVNPPLRTTNDIEALIEGLRDGTIDAIATDHAPHAAADKRGGLERAAFGISGLETALGAVLALVHRGDIDLATLVSRLTCDPARILRRDDIGTLKAGAAADVTLFQPDTEWIVDPAAFRSKGRNTPLAGRTLKGKVMATVYGGQVVYRDNAVKLEEAKGKARSRA